MTVEIVFETHSISVDNERGIATGWGQGRLSDRGKELAKQLGERSRGRNLDAVFTSDLRRAVETAEIAFGDSGIPIFRDARLRECNYGAMNGTPVAKLEAERARRVREPFPKGESYEEVVQRMEEFLDDLSRDWHDKRVLVIGHSATWFALEHLLKGASLEELVDRPYEWQEGWRYELGTMPPDKA